MVNLCNILLYSFPLRFFFYFVLSSSFGLDNSLMPGDPWLCVRI